MDEKEQKRLAEEQELERKLEEFDKKATPFYSVSMSDAFDQFRPGFTAPVTPQDIVYGDVATYGPFSAERGPENLRLLAVYKTGPI